MATTKKFTDDNNQVFELWLNDKGKVYMECYTFEDPYTCEFITLDKNDVVELIKELRLLKKQMQ